MDLYGLLEKSSSVLLSYLLNIIGAIVILILGKIFANWFARIVDRGMERVPGLDPTLKPLVLNILRYSIYVFVVAAVLAQFGVQTASIITVLGAAGLAIGLALQGTLSNIASGVMLILLSPLKVGEYIDAEGVAGTVVEIGLFSTNLKTFDGIFVSVPNSTLWSSTIKNYSRFPTRRIDSVVGISYEDDVDKAIAMLLEVLESEPRILSNPSPKVLVDELADSSVNLNMRGWVVSKDYWDVSFDLKRESKLKLESNGFTIPFPQRDIHLYPDKDQSS
ncbi:MAG: mechanosensitive ion channel domain-containing protein [Nitrospinota bacterium]|nr:mechanosensitive ion channel domain-containing protein [Nitrospinota bacterium]